MFSGVFFFVLKLREPCERQQDKEYYKMTYSIDAVELLCSVE